MTESQTAQIKRIESPAGNYYGKAAVWKSEAEYFIGVKNYSGWGQGELISKEFYDAWVKEFATKISTSIDKLLSDVKRQIQ